MRFIYLTESSDPAEHCGVMGRNVKAYSTEKKAVQSFPNFPRLTFDWIEDTAIVYGPDHKEIGKLTKLMIR